MNLSQFMFFTNEFNVNSFSKYIYIYSCEQNNFQLIFSYKYSNYLFKYHRKQQHENNAKRLISLRSELSLSKTALHYTKTRF